MTRAFASSLMAMLCLVLLAACQTNSRNEQSPTVAVTVTSSPFADVDAATAAAKSQYVKYLAASDAVGRSGGESVQPLEPYVTENELDSERNGAKYFSSHKIRLEGSSVLKVFKLQAADLRRGTLTAYACVDFSGTRLLDQDGHDVTPPSRNDRQTSIARFEWAAGRLLVSGTGSWSGDPLC